MRVDDRSYDHAEEALIDRAARGALSAADQARLERHLPGCPTCAAELEAMRAFDHSLAPGPDDEVLDRAAVDRAMACLGERQLFDVSMASGPGDEALDRAAVDRAMARLGERQAPSSRRRRLLRPATGIAALGAAAAAAVVFSLFHAPPPNTSEKTPETVTNTVAATVGSPRPLLLADGSEIVPDDATTAIRVGEETPVLTAVRLVSGAARFRVRHKSGRVFRVDAGPIAIEDLGTVFRVAHEAAGRVRVTVSEGRVAVLSVASRLRVELAAGDDRVFPATAAPHDAPDPVEAAKAPAATTVQASARAHTRAQLADDPAELLLAADLARRTGQPRDAVAPLRRLVDRYPKDPRAPAAAFTLGWVLLTDLNRPREAAVAFAAAEQSAPRGALAEDAAARVAEAWQKAGEARRAATAARHYEQVYPEGRYIALMRGLIGKR